MTPSRSPIDSYLRQLSRRLWLTAPLQRRTVLGEVEDHLRETAAALVAHGIDAEAAERQAVDRFGRYPIRHAPAVLTAGVLVVAVLAGLAGSLAGPKRTVTPSTQAAASGPPRLSAPEVHRLSVFLGSGLLYRGSDASAGVGTPPPPPKPPSSWQWSG